MSNPARNRTINYIEFASTNLATTKTFYSTVFGWSFQEYGPDYIAFSAGTAGINGGFYSRIHAGAGEDRPAHRDLRVGFEGH
jgi:predicted enzyme related to lactoylglutathione lyase